MGKFIYAPANPIWMNEVKAFNAAYNTVPFAYKQGNIPYTQKVKFAIPTNLQILSDWIPALKIYKCDTGVLIDTLAPSTPTTGIIGETFTCYEFAIAWGSYPAETYYIEVSYNTNGGSTGVTHSLTEEITPNFIDGSLEGKSDGNTIFTDFSATPATVVQFETGKSYSFEGFSNAVSPAPNPRIRLTVKKIVNGITTTIFDESEVQNGANSIVKTGIAQPGASYYAYVVTENTADVVTPIDVADDNPVNPDVTTWRSGAIQSAQNWPDTLVYEYSNSQNAFSVIWKTGIVMSMVIEGAIEDYEPGFEDIIYEDQYHNTTKINSIPFRQFTLYAGSATGFAGMPTYMGDKLNWVFSCDQIKIDGEYYQNVDGSKWEVARTPPYGTKFIGLKITIIEVNNLFLQSYDAGQIPAGAIKVVDRVLDYKNNSANITVSGIFTAASLLAKIVIYNNGGDIFTLNASTAADGSQPIAPPFTTNGQLKEVWDINEPFNAVSTLYLLGLAGTNCDIYIRYDQLDAPYILPPTPTKSHVKNTLYEYEETTPGDFSNDWNIGTGEGLGRYVGCVISGTNGTLDRNGLLSIGWNSSLPLTRDMLVGNAGNTIVQQPNQVGEHKHLMFNTDSSGGGNDLNDQSYVRRERNAGINRDYNMAKSNTAATLGSTSILNVGGAQPMDISNAARVTLKYVCITD